MSRNKWGLIFAGFVLLICVKMGLELSIPIGIVGAAIAVPWLFCPRQSLTTRVLVGLGVAVLLAMIVGVITMVAMVAGWLPPL